MIWQDAAETDEEHRQLTENAKLWWKPRLVLPDGAYMDENGHIIMPEGADWTQEPHYVLEEVDQP